MQEKATEFLQGVLAIAREEHLMSEGRLMSSTQVAEALSASTPWTPMLAGWFLCGDIHPELLTCPLQPYQSKVEVRVQG